MNDNIITAPEAYEIASNAYDKNFYSMLQSLTMFQIKSAAKRGEFRVVILYASKYNLMIDAIKEWLTRLSYVIERDRIDSCTCHELTIS